MDAAAYVVLLSRAVPGLTYEAICWKVSLAWGWAMIHAGQLQDGRPMVWAERRLSRRGRWWERVMERFGRGGGV